MLLFEAYDPIGVSLGMMINYCGPILVIVTAPLFFRERLTWQKGLALALAGALSLGSGRPAQKDAEI